MSRLEADLSQRGADAGEARRPREVDLVYLDHNATTPVRPEVAASMARAAVDCPGNPSSVHAWGRRARDAVERARAQVATLMGVAAEEIVFTSGGTEGDNLAIRGLLDGGSMGGRRHVVTSPLEHPAVLGALEAVSPAVVTTLLPISARGDVEPSDLEGALRADTALVTLALANHELGNVYPVARFAALAHARGALFHTDAVQAAGKLPLDLATWGVDAATVSAHKLGGPQGVGALYVRRGLDLAPLARGGHQERERRPGTENVAAIVGFGVACELAREALVVARQHQETLRRALLPRLLAIPGARVLGFGAAEVVDGLAVVASPPSGVGAADDLQLSARRLPGTVMVAFAGAPGQLVAIGLDLEGVCVSTGAACSSGSLEPSPVLRALGLAPEQAAEGVRISMGWTTTATELDRLAKALPEIVARVRGAVSAPSAACGSGAADAPAPSASPEQAPLPMPMPEWS